MQDKDYHCMYRGVAPYANSFITVTPDNPRSLPAGELAAYIRELGRPATACGTIREGVALALEQAGLTARCCATGPCTSSETWSFSCGS